MSRFFYALLLFAGLSACQNTDSALLRQIEQAGADFGQKTSQFEDEYQGVLRLRDLVSTAPEALKADSSSGYQALLDRVVALQQKEAVTLVEYKEKLAALAQLRADYQSGKLSAEQVKPMQEKLQEELKAMQDLFGRVGELAKETRAEFDKMVGGGQEKAQ